MCGCLTSWEILEHEDIFIDEILAALSFYGWLSMNLHFPACRNKCSDDRVAQSRQWRRNGHMDQLQYHQRVRFTHGPSLISSHDSLLICHPNFAVTEFTFRGPWSTERSMLVKELLCTCLPYSQVRWWNCSMKWFSLICYQKHAVSTLAIIKKEMSNLECYITVVWGLPSLTKFSVWKPCTNKLIFQTSRNL